MIFKDAADRELAEQAWAEYWQELQADDEALRLWYEAQEKEREILFALYDLEEQGLIEIPF
jgi:hypothetical protein